MLPQTPADVGLEADVQAGRRALLAQERNDLPTLRLGQVGEGWHPLVQRSVAQDPEQGSWRCLNYFRLIQGWHASTSLAFGAMACRAFASIQFGACSASFFTAFHGIG